MNVALGMRQNLAYVGGHAALLAGAVGFLFLQRYIWLLRIAEQGYGPYQTVSSLEGLSAVMIIIDLFILGWALRGSRTDKRISLLWPAFFFASTLLVLVANNL